MINRVAIVTGGAGGIGRAIAEEFVSQGYRVAVFDISTAETCPSADSRERLSFHRIDITDENAVMAGVSEVERRLGPVDILVNNAGLQFISAVEDFPYEKWQSLLSVMLSGSFLMTKHVTKGMKQRKFGRIINISSVHGLTASPYKSAYIAAKHGVIGLTRAVACEAAAHGVTCNAILPGAVDTELLRGQLDKLSGEEGISPSEALQKHILSKQPINRLIDTSEIAKLAGYLASDEAGAVTGEAIRISGGWR